MMASLRGYLLAVCAACILVALLQAMAPGKGTGRSLKLAGSLVILLVVIGPVVGVRTGTLTQLVEQAVKNLPQLQQVTTDDSEARISAIITERCTAYIWDKAEELGMTVAVELELSAGGGWPAPVRAVLRGRWTDRQQQALAEILERDLGISRQEQEWLHEGT